MCSGHSKASVPPSIVALLGVIVSFVGKSRFERLEQAMTSGFDRVDAGFDMARSEMAAGLADVRREVDIRFGHVEQRAERLEDEFRAVLIRLDPGPRAI